MLEAHGEGDMQEEDSRQEDQVVASLHQVEESVWRGDDLEVWGPQPKAMHYHST